MTFTKPEKLGLYTCTAANSLGKIIRRFALVEGFKPKTPSGLTVTRVGDNYIELQVAPNDKEDELIGYQVEYEARAVRFDGSNFESVNIMNLNSTEGRSYYILFFENINGFFLKLVTISSIIILSLPNKNNILYYYNYETTNNFITLDCTL